MPTITIHLFARARELAGSERIALELPEGANVGELRSRLRLVLPACAVLLERSAIAVNHDFADDTKTLRGDDEVAVIPPVSGG